MDARTVRSDSRPAGPAPRRDRSDSAPRRVMSREDWLRRYTGRVLQTWRRQKSPLGLTPAYAGCIRKDLAEHYRHPLMRKFIEETY